MKSGNGEQNDNIIYLSVVRPHYDKCRHWRNAIDEEKNTVECLDCGAELNPMWVLKRLADEESNFSRQRKLYIEAIKKYEEKKRAKCEHCGRITKLKQPKG